MKNIVYISILCLFLIVGCKTDNKQASNVLIENIIEIAPLKNDEKILYSELFDSLRYIHLETTNDILIRDVTRLKNINNRIYILDKRTQSVFCFDMDGKLQWKIHNIGQGPEEYMQFTDFGIDKKNNTIYLFSHRNKILEYNLSGCFVKEYNISLAGTSFTCNKDRIYVYANSTSNNIKGSETNNYLLLFDKNENTVEGKMPFKEDKRFGRLNTYNSSNAFVHYDNKLQFFMPFSNNIYFIKEDSIYIKYQFDFGEYNLPEDYFDDHTIEQLEESKYAYGLNSFWENDRYYSFNIYINKKNYNILYSKKEDQIYTETYDDIAYCFPTISEATDDYIIGSRTAEDLLVEYNYSKDKRKGTQLEQIISNITEDNNPVIFFYFKK